MLNLLWSEEPITQNTTIIFMLNKLHIISAGAHWQYCTSTPVCDFTSCPCGNWFDSSMSITEWNQEKHRWPFWWPFLWLIPSWLENQNIQNVWYNQERSHKCYIASIHFLFTDIWQHASLWYRDVFCWPISFHYGLLPAAPKLYYGKQLCTDAAVCKISLLCYTFG